MSDSVWIVATLVVAGTYIGFISPLLPFLWIVGRVITPAEAWDRVNAGNGVITYNDEMGGMHRVWWSLNRPVTSHWRGLREGSVVWIPFSGLDSVKRRFADWLVVSFAGDRLDMMMDDGRTFFDYFWEYRKKNRQEASDANRESRTT